ncbi:hypothetical protein BDB01DRAFT_782875 [Pilobolus umbonatus]|nr:hypothetical protein BDB01DRAFT_782875 [Pilobolus umbonatus]
MLTVGDFINLIHYYYHHKDSYLEEIENIQIEELRNKQHDTGLIQQHYSIHPMATLYDVAILMTNTRAHRIPLVIENREIISVITQYRLMKFIANNKVDDLKVPLSQLKIGTYGESVATASMSTPVIDIIKMLACQNISAVPIVDEKGTVLNLYDTIDVMSLVRSERYSDLDIPVSEAIEVRPSDFTGVSTCTMNDSLYSIFKALRKKRIYRLVVIEPSTHKLVGLLSLSDILGYFLSKS